MLDHVQCENGVIAALTEHGVERLVEIEGYRLRAPCFGRSVEAGRRDVPHALGELRAENPAIGPKVGDVPIGVPVLGEDVLMKRVGSFLDQVAALFEHPEVELRLEEQAGVREPHFGHGLDAVQPILDAVDTADLISVERRDGDLHDPSPGSDQLDEYLGVEMEIIGVQLERDLAKHVDLVGAVPRVELRELSPEHPVFDCRQDLIPDPLVQRHSAS